MKFAQSGHLTVHMRIHRVARCDKSSSNLEVVMNYSCISGNCSIHQISFLVRCREVPNAGISFVMFIVVCVHEYLVVFVTVLYFLFVP